MKRPRFGVSPSQYATDTWYALALPRHAFFAREAPGQLDDLATLNALVSAESPDALRRCASFALYSKNENAALAFRIGSVGDSSSLLRP